MGRSPKAILVLLLLCAAFGRAAAEENEFAFVFQCDVKKNVLCLTNRYPNGHKFHLLGSKSNVCDAVTSGTIKFQQGLKETVISRMDTSRCPNRGSYFMASEAETVSRFRRYVPDKVNDRNLVDRVDNAIKLMKFYSTANTYFGGTLANKPTLFFPIPLNDNVIVAQYPTVKPKDPNEKYGPIYMYINGDVREIASEGLLGYFFTMDDRFYMTYRSGCWQGCGILAEVLIEIGNDGFRRILIDGFFGT
jgi:hypothetical protein